MPDDVRYRELAGEVRRRLPAAGRPLLVGITGPVAVGKSTTAEILRSLLVADGVRVDLLCTDCFLHPNAVLAARNLTMRKGYPETFDTHTMAECLGRLRHGEVPVDVPHYSHAVYDILPDVASPIGAADVVIIEGVNALQPPALEHLDLSVYVDAEEAHVREWFVDRFLSLCAAADGDSDEGSFYRMFSPLSEDERRGIAVGAWETINLPNLRDHIEPSRAGATFVLHKAADHTVVALAPAS